MTGVQTCALPICGGVIRFAIAGACELDGTLSANGAAGVNSSNGGTGGGGAGGTIRLACDTLAGTGVLRADGGDGGEDTVANGFDYGNGGGGGGGRIALRFASSTFSNQAGISVAGGLGGVSPGPDGVDGGSGTVALITVGAGANPLTDDTKDHDTDLELYRSWRWEPSVEFESVEQSFSYQSVTVQPGTEVVAGDGDVMVSAVTFSMNGASWDTMVSSSNGTANSGSGSVSLEVTTLNLNDSTLVADSSSHDWSIAVSSSSDISGGSIDGQNVTFTGTGNLAFENSMQLTAEKIELTGNSVSQDATTVFSTDSRGYASDLGFEDGAGVASATQAGGGGGHGGDGGAGGGGGSGGVGGGGRPSGGHAVLRLYRSSAGAV